MAFIGKTYKYEKEENWEGFLSSLELPADRTEALKNFKPTHQLKKDGDTYTFITDEKETSFKSGVEFDENVGGIKPGKTTITVNGDTVTQVQKFEDGRVITFKREYSGNNLVLTVTTSFWDGVATRYYTAA